MYNGCELIVAILLTFRHFRGLYFWSLLISSIGIIPYSLGFLLKFMNVTTGNARWLAVVLLTIGWYPMITGESLVLWSRLHLVVTRGKSGDKIIQWTKWMIIVDAILLHIPTTVLTFGSNGTMNVQVFERGYNVMEKIQMIGFFIQEVILSSIYIIETVRLLRTSLRPDTRKTMKQLILINAVIIAMDLGLLGLECASLYILETLLKGVIYSIKLKLEFAILGKLVKFVGHSQPGADLRKHSIGFITASDSKYSRELDTRDFVDLNRVSTDVSHPSRARRPTSRAQRIDSQYNLARFEHVDDASTLQKPDRASIEQSPLRNGDDAV